jgi:hypothetical protein
MVDVPVPARLAAQCAPRGHGAFLCDGLGAAAIRIEWPAFKNIIIFGWLGKT